MAGRSEIGRLRRLVFARLFFFEQFYRGHPWYGEGWSGNAYREPEGPPENHMNPITLSRRKAP